MGTIEVAKKSAPTTALGGSSSSSRPAGIHEAARVKVELNRGTKFFGEVLYKQFVLG
jgi:hypothetical protein